MKGYFFICLILVLIGSACRNSPGGAAGDELTEQLKRRKQQTDRLLSDSSLLVFVKVKGGQELIRVSNKRYPRDIETTYNLLKDSAGRVIYLAELPFNKESDWFIAYKSYFDTAGNLYAFQRINNFLNNECVKGALMENMMKYYDADFNVTDSVYTLTDTYKKPIENADACKFPYNFPYQIFRTAEEYRQARGIPVP